MCAQQLFYRRKNRIRRVPSRGIRARVIGGFRGKIVGTDGWSWRGFSVLGDPDDAISQSDQAALAYRASTREERAELLRFAAGRALPREKAEETPNLRARALVHAAVRATLRGEAYWDRRSDSFSDHLKRLIDRIAESSRFSPRR